VALFSWAKLLILNNMEVHAGKFFYILKKLCGMGCCD